MNMFKKNGGFTLVELIVVIAILAILAGIAVPAYSGYLQSAEKAGDITALSAVKTAAAAAWATKGEVTDIVVEATDGEITTVKINGEEVKPEGAAEGTKVYKILYSTTEPAEITNFGEYITELPTLGFFKNGAQWPDANGDWTEVPTEGE